MTVSLSGNCVLPESLFRSRNFESKTRIMNGKMDEKEVEDRLVAAEAMSALASLVLVNPVSSASSPPDVEKPAPKKRAPRKKKEKGTAKAKKNADKNENTNNSSGNLENGASDRPGRIVKANGTTKSKNSNSGNSGKSRKKSAGSKQTLPNVSPSASPAVTPAVTQCIATQTVPNEEPNNRQSLPSFNLGLPLFSRDLSLISLPSIPSIEALKLSQNIDLAAFPNVNTVDLVLGGYNRQQSASSHQDGASGSGQDEGERSLPFKKRRYANTSEERGGADASLPSLNLSGATPFVSDKGKQPEVKPDPLRSIKFNPQFGSQLMREITVALTPDEDGDLPLHIAVVHENLPMIKKFIQLMKLARKSVDKFNKQKQTPLHLAVKLNLQDAVKMLLEADSDVNYVDQNGCTSLHLAVQNRLPRLIDLFYTNSRVTIDINTRNFEGFTPLHTAVSLNDDEMINILLDKGMDIDIVDGKSGRTALFHAVECEKKAIVCLLLKKGANAEIQNYASNTAIMAATARNLREISGLLTCKSNDIPDYEIDNSSRSSSVEIQDRPPGLLRVIDSPDNKLPEVSSLPTSILTQSQTDFHNPVMGKPFSMSVSKVIVKQNEAMDQPLDLHVEKKQKNKPEKQVSPSAPQKMEVDSQADDKSVQLMDVVTEHTPPVISISENGMIFTEQPADASKIPHQNVVTERISPPNQVLPIIPKFEKHSAIRTVLTSSQQPVSSSVMSMLSSVTSTIPTVTSDMTYATFTRTPAMIPSGIPTYIKPELKAKIQQNLMNKKLKAQLSEEKRD